MPEDHAYFMSAEADLKRLAMNHEVIKQAMGGTLIMAPIDLTRPGLKILDAGTADGLWIRDFMRDNPAITDVIGTDIDESRFPSNLPAGITLLKQDMRDAWPQDWKDAFDLIHQRFLLVGSQGDPQPVVNRLCEIVKPGGWVQLIEADQLFGEQDGPAQRQFITIFKDMVDFLKTPFYFARDMSRYLKEAGFVKIGEMTVPMSVGVACPEPKLREQSITAYVMGVQAIIGFVKNLPGSKGISEEDMESLPSRLEAELRAQGAYYPLRAVWGQKPLPV